MMTVTTPHTWRSAILGEFFRIKHGYAFKGEYFSESGPYVLLTPGNFCPDGGIKLKGEKEKYYVGPFPDEFLLQRDDLLVVMTDLTQTAAILGSPAFIPHSNRFLHNQRLGKMYDISPDIAKRFLYHLLNTEAVRSQIKGSATGATVRHTAPDRIYAVKVTIPPLPTQRKIAAILSAYDDLIENNLRRIKLLEEMAQNLYYEWFIKFRFPGHQHARFTDSSLGRIPEGWDVVKLGKLLEIRKGKNITKKTVVEGSVPVVAGGMKPAYYHNVPNTRQPVITISASGANAGFVCLYHEDVWASDCSVIDSDTTPHVYYFYLYLKNRHTEVTRLQRGAAQPHVYPKDLMYLDANEVPMELLERFNQEVTAVFQMIRNLTLKNTSLRRTRDLLLPRLISGEVDVSELDITVPEEGNKA